MEVRVVTNSSDDMGEAIGCLSEHGILSMDCEGVDLGRYGEICLVQLSTNATCFLFDVKELTPSSELVLALRPILEDENIVKIIHDCKMDSDALLHKLGIRLAGVHDTQVWDKVLNQSELNLNLNRTLEAYGCTPNVERSSDVYERNHCFWSIRPMTAQMIDWASGDVGSLFELYEMQLERATARQRKNARKKCKNSTRFMQDSVMLETRIDVRNFGRFIGPGGSNVRKLIGKVPGTFIQTPGQRNSSGVVLIYGPDDASVLRLDGLLSRYK